MEQQAKRCRVDKHPFPGQVVGLFLVDTLLLAVKSFGSAGTRLEGTSRSEPTLKSTWVSQTCPILSECVDTARSKGNPLCVYLLCQEFGVYSVNINAVPDIHRKGVYDLRQYMGQVLNLPVFRYCGIAVSADDRYLAVLVAVHMYRNDFKGYIVEIATKHVVASFSLRIHVWSSSDVFKMQFTEDGSRLVCVSPSGEWNIIKKHKGSPSTSTWSWTVKSLNIWIEDMSFAAFGKSRYAYGTIRDCKLTVGRFTPDGLNKSGAWSLGTRPERKNVEIYNSTFTPDGKYLIVFCKKKHVLKPFEYVVDIATGKVVRKLCLTDDRELQRMPKLYVVSYMRGGCVTKPVFDKDWQLFAGLSNGKTFTRCKLYNDWRAFWLWVLHTALRLPGLLCRKIVCEYLEARCLIRG